MITPNMDGIVNHNTQSDDGDPDTEPKLAALLLNRSALKQLPDPEALIDNVLDQGT
jgi:hypothetical protein